MDRGTSSIQTMLSTVVFNIGPAIFDIAAASVYMALNLQPWIAVIVFITLRSVAPSFFLIKLVALAACWPAACCLASPNLAQEGPEPMLPASCCPALPCCSSYIPMTIILTEWRGKFRR